MFDRRNVNKNFMVAVDGIKFDTRAGMTWPVYQAFIAEAKAKGVDPLPDSQQLANQNGEVWTHTWLPGEEADVGSVP